MNHSPINWIYHHCYQTKIGNTQTILTLLLLHPQICIMNKKIKSCSVPRKLPRWPLFPDRYQNCKKDKSFTNMSVTQQIPEPLKMLPHNIKRTLIINKVRDEQEEKKTEPCHWNQGTNKYRDRLLRHQLLVKF